MLLVCIHMKPHTTINTTISQLNQMFSRLNSVKEKIRLVNLLQLKAKRRIFANKVMFIRGIRHEGIFKMAIIIVLVFEGVIV
jgi:hypothetical protein